MRIALIQPVTGTESTKIVRVVREPLGLLYIAAALNDESYLSEMKTTHYEAKIFHPIERVEPRAVVPLDDETLIADIKSFSPDAIGISAMTYNFEKGIDIAAKIKASFGKIPIIFGGYHVSGCARQYSKWKNKPGNEAFLKDLESIFETDCVDFIVVGEGERTIVALLECVKNKGDLQKVPGIAYQDKGGIVVTYAKRIADVDSLPIPDRSQLDWNIYRSSLYADTVATIHTTRGCRYNCYYCSTPTTWGKGLTERSPRNVVDEIEYLVNNFAINRITFADEDFFSDFERVNEICTEIMKRNITVRWDSFANVVDILRKGSEELLHHLKQAGAVSFFVGIESLNMDTLIDFNRPDVKKYDIDRYLEDIQSVINKVSSAGIEFYGDYMVGYPSETEETLRKGFDRLKTLRDMPYIYLPILAAFPGTHLYEESKRNNWFLPGKSFLNFDCSQQILTSGVDDVSALRDEFEIAYYTNSDYGRDAVKRILADPARFENVLHIYGKLAQDYPCNAQLSAIAAKLEEIHGSKTESMICELNQLLSELF